MLWKCILLLLVLLPRGQGLGNFVPRKRFLESDVKYTGNDVPAKPVLRKVREIDESVEEAQARLFDVDRAANALTGVEKGVKADPLLIEDQTDQITKSLRSDIAKYKAAKKDSSARSDESVVALAKRILKIVTTLEVAKFMADSKAREAIEIAEKRGIHRPTAYQFPQYNYGYLYGLPSLNPGQDMTQPFQQTQQASAQQLNQASSVTPQNTQPAPPPPSPPPLPPLPPMSPVPLPVMQQYMPSGFQPDLEQNLPQGSIPMTGMVMKDNSNEPQPQTNNAKAPKHEKVHAPKRKVYHKELHKPAEEPSGVITPEDQAQWSIFGDSVPIANKFGNEPAAAQPQAEQPQMPAPEQLAPAAMPVETGSPLPQVEPNTMPEEGTSDYSSQSQTSPQELPGLRPLDSELVRPHHQEKPQLFVKPPPVTQKPSPSTQSWSAPSPPASPSPPPPPPPPPAAPLLPAPAFLPPSTPPAAAPVSSATLLPQMDSSNQASMQQNIPIAPIPPPQYYAPNYVPLSSIPLPVFLSDDTPDVRVAKEKDYETRKSAIAVENIEKAIGLDENTIESLIDDVKRASEGQKIRYESAILKDRNDEQSAKHGKKAEAEEKMLKDEELEEKAKETVNQINDLERVMTVVEAAKFDAQRRASQQLQVAEIWKNRLYGKAKKRNIITFPKSQKNVIDKASKLLENIVKKQKVRKRNVKTDFELHGPIRILRNGGKMDVEESRIKRSSRFDFDTRNPFRAKFKLIRNLAQEILKNIPNTN